MPQKIKTVLRINPIMDYLKRLVIKSGSVPELLPGEMELSEKFQVSRGTVRRALDTLIRNGYVIRLPKRRGYFTNPALAGQSSFHIGVLVARAQVAGLAAPSMMIFSAFAESMGFSFPWDCEFITLPSQNPKQIISELRNSSFDGLLWIALPEQYSCVVDELLNCYIPVVAVENVYVENRTPPSNNFFAYDFSYGGECRARAFLKTNCRKLFYCGTHAATAEHFGKVLREQHLPFDETHILENLDDIPEKLTGLLDGDLVDGIACDGGTLRYDKVFSTLSSHPKGKNVTVLIEREGLVLLNREKYPEQPVLELDTLDIGKTSRRAGKLAGNLLRQILLHKKGLRNKTVVFQ